ncbi:putative reverse transcriptase domain-containing protein [Tanacetum coccineum]|uniref:Reverse transcriptase domain-containing protein n=1 Tax=Tanacetum coccineum TaxID=301880 RepID=A0ABQ5BLC7_9ASTR
MERAKPLRVRALVMTINSNLPPQIHKTQVESLKTENVKDENLHGIDNEFENRLDGTLYIGRKSRLPRVSLWKGVIRFSKRGKLDPRYIRPFKIIAKVGTVVYHLELPEKLSRVHSTFHVSNLKKCLADEPLAIPLDEIQVDDKLHFIKELVKIMDREVKHLKQSRDFQLSKYVGTLGRVLSSPGNGEAVNTACYTQNRSIIVKIHGKTSYDVFRGRSPDISYFHVFGYPVHIHNHMDHLGKFNEKADDGFFLGYSPVAKAFRFIDADDHPALNELEQSKSVDNLEPAKIQDYVTNEPISDVQSLPTINSPSAAVEINPSAKGILQPHVPHDRWSREKHIKLVNIIGKPLAGITARSRIKDLEAASAHECLYVNFLFEMEPKKRIKALEEEEGWIIAIQEKLNQFEMNKGYNQQEGFRGLRILPEDILEPALEGAVEVTYETLGDLVQRFHDHTKAIPVHRIHVIEGVQREQGHRIVGVESAVIALTERIVESERDNRRIRGITSVESQRVDRLQRGMKMPNTRSGASMTHEEVEELVTHQVAGEIEAREAAKTLEPLNENGDEQEGENGGNGNGGNGGNGNGGNEGNGNGGKWKNLNGNRNGNHGMNYGGFMPVARECTFQDFLKCKPHNFSGTEGIVGLTRWFKKMETLFNISNFPPKYQVKYATCTLLDSALTWNEIQKMETELWNLTVKGNGLTAYTQRFQELILLCTRMVPDEEDRVERFIGRLPDNIQGNKLQGYAARSAENKRRMESNPRDNSGQQPLFKRQNVSGQNVARAYAAGNNKKRGYARPHPLCNKCRYHHVGPCTVKCNNCKRVGHQTRDCRSAAAVPNTQRAPLGN